MISYPPRALVAMLAGAACLSTGAVWVKLAEVPPSVSAFWRMAFGALFLGIWLLWTRRPFLARGKGSGLYLLAALAFAIDLFLYHRSILLVGPGLATLLANFQVFVLAVVGGLLFREVLGPRFFGGLAMAVAGLWLMVGIGWAAFTPEYRVGVWFGLATALAYATYILLLRRAQQAVGASRPETGLWQVSLACAAMMWLSVAVEGHSVVVTDATSLGYLALLGLVTQVGGWLLILYAIPRLPASLVGLLLLLQPSLAFVWDVWLFARPVTSAEGLGIALALAGIFFGTVRRRA
ncbi:MAG TPA: DMT family transporter [Xanthomonadaceae bacterium]|nr:DMT family transporter [Xanthomonadaceae bacterium]